MTTNHLTLEELSAWLDGEVELTAVQQAHLKGCAECTGAVERQQGLRRVARLATPPVPSDRMWKAIDARIAGTKPGHRSEGLLARLRLATGGRRLPIAGLATGLAMVAIVIATRPVPRQIEVIQPPPLKEETPPREQPAEPLPPTSAPPAREQQAKRQPATEGRSAARPTRTAKKAPTEKTKPATAEPTAQPAPSPAAPAPAAPLPAREGAGSGQDRTTPPAAPANTATLDRREPAPAAAPAKAARARSVRSMDASEAAAPASAPMAAEAVAESPVRVTWTGRAVVITADREWHPTADRVILTGHVLILPRISGSSYLASVNGFTRTLSGQTPASMAEVSLPKEALLIKP